MPYYRLSFNASALILLTPGLWLTFSQPGEHLWQWQGVGLWLSWALSLAAWAGFAYSLKFYDTQEFLGLRQLRQQVRTVEDQERFKLSPLHRFVRHPWYFLGMLILWLRDMTPELLLTSVAVSIYFLIGSQLEERKLMHYHGEQYRRYRKLVPGLLPLPWKHLSKAEALELVSMGSLN